MIRTVEPASQIRGSVTPPGDKSISHRALLLNALATGRARIENLSNGLDVLSTRVCLEAMGVRIGDEEGGTVVVQGVGVRGLAKPEDVLQCGNSATTMRLLAGVVAGQGFEAVLEGDVSLGRRPMERVAAPLRQMGAEVTTGHGGRPPLRVSGSDLRGIDFVAPAPSAQVKSAILLAALNATGMTMVGEPIPTRNHTEIALLEMGCDLVAFQGNVLLRGPAKRLKPRSFRVPGDISSAAFWLAAAAAHPQGQVHISSVGLNPTRTGIFSVLQAMGAGVIFDRQPLRGGEPVGDVTLKGGSLSAVAMAPEMVAHLVDEIPVLAVIATQATGVTRITGAGDLRNKESDRLAGIASGLKLLGAKVRELEDGLEITGPTPLGGGEVDSMGDHRLAMAFAVAALLGTAPVAIRDAECVEISYPGFWDDLERLAAG